MSRAKLGPRKPPPLQTATLKIYALVDPRTDKIRYVGHTYSDPKERLRAHLRRQAGTKAKRQWLASLKEADLQPRIRILHKEEVAYPKAASRPPVDTAQEIEKSIIRKLLEDGKPLTNGDFAGEKKVQVGLMLPVTLYEELKQLSDKGDEGVSETATRLLRAHPSINEASVGLCGPSEVRN